MRAIKAIAAVSMMLAAPAAAQEDISLGGTLKKRQGQLAALMTGRFTNKEQAAFSPALTAEGEEPFETVHHIVVTKTEAGLIATSEAGELLDDLALETVVEDEQLLVRGEGCTGTAEALLDGFQVRFDGRKNRRCPLAPVMTVLPKGLHLAATKTRPALQLARAQDYRCWVTLPRREDKGWFFEANVPLHDQGGETWIETDEDPPQSVGLKMRQAVWPYGRSRPSLVLYIHKPETPDRATSYTWANPEAERIGINLRWMQASCTRGTN